MATTSPSIKLIRASDGSGNASAATVQNTRSPGATTIQVDTVQGIPDNFYASMGTPHTFTDPVTGETITVISEASAVDFEGHVDGTNLEIDDIAAGYTDNGSAVGDIVIIRPITSYANNIADVLDVAHNDDGTLKDEVIDSRDLFTDPLDPITRLDDLTTGDYVASGGVVAIVSALTGSFTDIVYYIAGVRYTKTGVANKVYTASKDTYVDIGIDGTVDYNEVANGAAAPALAANHIRLAKVVTNGSAITSVSRGGSPDSLGNLMYPGNPLAGIAIPLLARQGGSATVPGTVGTTNYDTRGEKMFMQMGIFSKPSAGEDSVTFPVPFRYTPLIMCWVASANGANCWVRFKIASSSNTGIGGIQAFNTAGANVSGEYIGWLAIGV